MVIMSGCIFIIFMHLESFIIMSCDIAWQRFIAAMSAFDIWLVLIAPPVLMLRVLLIAPPVLMLPVLLIAPVLMLPVLFVCASAAPPANARKANPSEAVLSWVMFDSEAGARL